MIDAFEGANLSFAGDKMRLVEKADGSADIIWDDKGIGRSCGSCTLCCKLLPVPSLGKADNTRCRHQRAHVGCTIYPTRPHACRAWTCRWMADASTAGLPRPDRAHYVIDLSYDFIRVETKNGGSSEVTALQIWVDPAFRNAWDTPGLRAWINDMGGRYGVVAIIRWSSSEGMIVAPPTVNADRTWFQTPGQVERRTHERA